MCVELTHYTTVWAHVDGDLVQSHTAAEASLNQSSESISGHVVLVALLLKPYKRSSEI